MMKHDVTQLKIEIESGIIDVYFNDIITSFTMTDIDICSVKTRIEGTIVKVNNIKV